MGCGDDFSKDFPQQARIDLIKKKKCHTKSQETTISLILPPLFDFRVSIYPQISSKWSEGPGQWSSPWHQPLPPLFLQNAVAITLVSAVPLMSTEGSPAARDTN